MAEYVDLIFCVGVLVMFAAFPSAVGAFSRGAPARMTLMFLFVGGGMIAYANASRPGGYSVAELPDVFMRVFAG